MTKTNAVERRWLMAAVAGATVALMWPMGSAQAVPAPKYLMVKDFRLCLASEPVGTYRRLCLPAEKPEACPAESWAQLKGLTGVDRMEACAAAEQGGVLERALEKAVRPASGASGS